MGFAKQISPTNRILEQLDLSEKVHRLGMIVPLEFKNEEGNNLAICSSCYVFSAQKLQEFVSEIVDFSYDETFNLIKRKMRQMEETE